MGAVGRGECMVEERHYVEEEPAFISNRGICGRHARSGRWYRRGCGRDVRSNMGVVKLFMGLLIGRYKTQCVGGGVFFSRGAVYFLNEFLCILSSREE
jgi:hypothetical protein